VVVRSVAEEGRTVVFSSHLLDEVERVADDVAMIHEGEVALFTSMDELKATHCRVVVEFPQAKSEFPEFSCALDVQGEGREWALICQGETVAVRAAVERAGARILEESVPTLDAIFIARVTGQRRAAEAMT
jgi:ABC-2 type transport system ATP-binding protein